MIDELVMVEERHGIYTASDTEIDLMGGDGVRDSH